MPTVQSSNIRDIGYDPKTNILTVTFKSGIPYTYTGVDEATYNEFVASPSPGGFFTRNIRDRFPTRKG